MAMDENIPVFLFKTKSTPIDRYGEFLEVVKDARYKPIFVPVLEHGLIDEAGCQLEKLIVSKVFRPSSSVSSLESQLDSQHKSGLQSTQYGGIIFTSQRAVEAFAKVITRLVSQPGFVVEEYLDENTTLYVVGPATHCAVQALGLSCCVAGQETGNGEALAAFILKHHSHHDTTSKRSALLFLVGEQRRDIIPKTLQSHTLADCEQIRVDEIVVYQTIERSSFRAHLESLLKQYQAPRIHFIIFSPTGCKTMLEVLGFPDQAAPKFNGIHLDRIKIATIGPTTRHFLINEFGFMPHGMADEPTPEGVAKAILSLDDQETSY